MKRMTERKILRLRMDVEPLLLLLKRTGSYLEAKYVLREEDRDAFPGPTVLPDDARLIAVRVDPAGQQLLIEIEADSFPDLWAGETQVGTVHMDPCRHCGAERGAWHTEDCAWILNRRQPPDAEPLPVPVVVPAAATCIACGGTGVVETAAGPRPCDCWVPVEFREQSPAAAPESAPRRKPFSCTIPWSEVRVEPPIQPGDPVVRRIGGRRFRPTGRDGDGNLIWTEVVPK